MLSFRLKKQTSTNVAAQHLRIKRINPKTTDLEYHLQDLKERLVNQGYNEKSIDQQFSKVKTIERNELLKEKTHEKETQNKIPPVLIYNSFLTNINNTVRKHCKILHISKKLQGLFQEESITAFKRKSSLKELLENNCMENGQKS